MLVKIEEIRGLGIELQEAIKPEVLQQALSNAPGYELIFAQPLVATFKRVSGQVHLHGGFETTIAASCHRCLKTVRLDLPVRFSMRMVPVIRDEKTLQGLASAQQTGKKRHRQKKADGDTGKGLVAASFDLDELDAEPFDGKTIDLDPIIQEQVLLALPVTVLCNDDCKGLCGTCGEDLNKQLCGHCVNESIHRPLAKLKDIALQDSLKPKN